MQQYFKDHKTIESIQAAGFENHFNVALKELPPKAGCAGDYEIVESGGRFPVGTIIEFKIDKMSKKTGRVYIEFEQTRDNFFTSKSSGVKLALEEGQIVVFTCPNADRSYTNYVIETLEDYRTLETKSIRTVATRQNVNFNPNGVRSRGFIVSRQDMDFLFKFDFS